MSEIEEKKIEKAHSELGEICSNHSCEDCPLEPRQMMPCAYATLHDHWKYIQTQKTRNEVKQ